MREEQKVNYGSIQIHKKVLADIVLSVIHETDGVILASQCMFSRLMQMVGRRTYSGIAILIDKENDVSIEVRVNVRYGLNIPDISRHLQDTIRDAIEKSTDINLKDVHINIQGIEGGV